MEKKGKSKKVTSKPAKKSTTKKVSNPKKVEEKPEPVTVEEEICEVDPIEKNPARAYMLRDVWFESLSQVIDEELVPEENRREMLFLTLSNALLDMVLDIVPSDLASVIAENMDDFLTITVVNKENNVDLLQIFKQDFVQEAGDTFEDEFEVQEALTKFENQWWNAKRKDLDGKSPNEAIAEVSKRYDL